MRTLPKLLLGSAIGLALSAHPSPYIKRDSGLLVPDKKIVQPAHMPFVVGPPKLSGTRTIAIRNHTSSTGTTLTLSGLGISSGDLCVIANLCSDDTTTPTSVVPSGFTQLSTTDTGTGFGQHQRFNFFYKVCTGSETTVSVMSGNQADDTLAVIWSKSSGTWGTPASVVNASDLSGATTPANQTITAGSGTAPLLVVGINCVFINSPTGVVNLIMSPTADASFTTSQYTSLGYKIYAASPANNTISSSSGSSTVLAGFYVQLGP